MKYLSMIVVDPQVGFCSPSGSLGLNYGNAELAKVVKVIPNIKLALDLSHRRHVVKSEYSIGQFTEGDTEHALANLCVSRVNKDCNVIGELSFVSYNSSTIKHQPSALSAKAFFSEIESDLEIGVKHFVIAGFLLEHCVRATAVDLAAKLDGSGAEVFVCSDLPASRSEKYKNGVVTSTIETLSNHGVQYCKWQSIWS